MSNNPHRRAFLSNVGAAATGLLLPSHLIAAQAAAEPTKAEDKPIKVVVWDEQQPAQKEAYPNFLGNYIAKYLESRPGLAVQSVKLDDPQQGLAPEVIDACQVLIWWGHKRNAEITPETGKKLVERIQAGTLSLIALHSAHWSTPFMEAMNERTRRDSERRFAANANDKPQITYVAPPQRYTLPKPDAPVTPFVNERKFPDGTTKVSVQLPTCCFPAYRTDGKPSQIRVQKPDHPLVKDVPRTFQLPHTEMYDEPFHVPDPDEVILEECWEKGEWFRSGLVWTLGKGRIFYFRPGHETYAVYKEKPVLQILENAVRWLAAVGG